jgi:hypothetical protein
LDKEYQDPNDEGEEEDPLSASGIHQQEDQGLSLDQLANLFA